MAKGDPYRLVEGATGYRILCVSNSLWPAMTGMLSDNWYQFAQDCWLQLLEEVISMLGSCLPESYCYTRQETWIGDGVKVWQTPAVPAGVKRRIAHIFMTQSGSTSCDYRATAVKNSDKAGFFQEYDVPQGVARVGLSDVLLVEGDYIEFSFTVDSIGGTAYMRLWGEEWTI